MILMRMNTPNELRFCNIKNIYKKKMKCKKQIYMREK